MWTHTKVSDRRRDGVRTSGVQTAFSRKKCRPVTQRLRFLHVVGGGPLCPRTVGSSACASGQRSDGERGPKRPFLKAALSLTSRGAQVPASGSPF